MALEERTVYRVIMTGKVDVEATDNQGAIDKTIAYFATHLDELTYQITTFTALIEA